MLASEQGIKNDNRTKFENMMRHVHDCGVRAGDDVLVVGQVCDAALQALAKRVGKRGSLTIVDSDIEALAAIDTKAGSATYTYFQSSYNMHPAFDPRPMSSRYQPVCLQTHLLETTRLPFSAETFNIIWIASLPRDIAHSELKRVTKNRGRIANLTTDTDHAAINRTQPISLQITYL